jgi:catechol 2,3-dioxygenase-like lactoylglutathione lyase family enzyme
MSRPDQPSGRFRVFRRSFIGDAEVSDHIEPTPVASLRAQFESASSIAAASDGVATLAFCTTGVTSFEAADDRDPARYDRVVSPAMISAGFASKSCEANMSTVNVRYMVDDVEAAVAWYTRHLGFTLLSSAAPAFADVALGSLRLLLSGPTSSAGRPMQDGERPKPGGWNRIHLIVDDLAADVARLRAAGAQFRNEAVTGPGGSQILLVDPSGNLVELFQPAKRS